MSMSPIYARSAKQYEESQQKWQSIEKNLSVQIDEWKTTSQLSEEHALILASILAIEEAKSIVAENYEKINLGLQKIQKIPKPKVHQVQALSQAFLALEETYANLEKLSSRLLLLSKSRVVVIGGSSHQTEESKIQKGQE